MLHVKPQTICIVLSLAISKNWEVRQLDLNNAILNWELQETVYMVQAKGFKDETHSNHVCKLIKALYQEAKLDASLSVYVYGLQFFPLLVYVDDILLTGSNFQMVNKLIHDLNAAFTLKDLGDLHYFLDIEIFRDSIGFYLTQTKYIIDLLIKLTMLNCKPYTTPASTSVKLTCTIGQPL